MNPVISIIVPVYKVEKQLNKLQHKGESRRADERLKDSFQE